VPVLQITTKIRGFDGLRALAVISVVFTHLHALLFLVKSGYIPMRIAPMLDGFAGVQVFFVLSGFLITTLLIREASRTGRISIRNFMVRRILRIFPLYIVFLMFTLALILTWGTGVTSWASFFFAAAYIYNFVPRDLYTAFMGHLWSLAVEEHFYLIWPISFSKLLGRSKAVSYLTITGFIIFCFVCTIWLQRIGVDHRFFVVRWSFTAGFSIAMGCLAAVALDDDRFSLDKKAWLTSPWFLVIALILYCNSVVMQTGLIVIDDLLSSYIRCAGIMLLIVYVYSNQASLMVAALEWRPLRYVGAISYGIYMYQGLFIGTGPERSSGQIWPPSVKIGFALMCIAAPLSYHFLEKPILRLKGRFEIKIVPIVSKTSRLDELGGPVQPRR
jgi:peptidoglycan/LPS O-acetylase OafA/YrhL